jgi:hypothetical protein
MYELVRVRSPPSTEDEPMARKLIDVLSLLAFVCAGAMAAAHDDDRDRGDRRDHRERAAELKDCCTPGDEDFPKVGGNLGNQNYAFAAWAPPGSTTSKVG